MCRYRFMYIYIYMDLIPPVPEADIFSRVGEKNGVNISETDFGEGSEMTLSDSIYLYMELG